MIDLGVPALQIRRKTASVGEQEMASSWSVASDCDSHREAADGDGADDCAGSDFDSGCYCQTESRRPALFRVPGPLGQIGLYLKQSKTSARTGA